MAKLSYRKKKRLTSRAFVFPKGTKSTPGKKKFPIPNIKHARNALSRAAQKGVRLTARERCKVVRVVCSRFPSISICKGESSSRRLSKCHI